MKLYLWCSGQLLYDWNSQPSADNNAKSKVINILQPGSREVIKSYRTNSYVVYHRL